MAGLLYLVGTPIGNLGDMSPRAKETLESVDFIAAEDTRVTLKLLNHFGIRKPLVSYYEHNRAASGERIAERLEAGESCALVTDAGMPAISDPGEDLVRLCRDRDIEVRIVPGPSSVVSALALSALPTGRFTFEGFLSVTKKSRFEHLNSLKGETRTMIFLEAPHKLKATLADMLAVFGDREISLSRELTKIHEETLHLTLARACEMYAEISPRGEYVLCVRGSEPPSAAASDPAEAVDAVLALRGKGLSLKEASRRISEDTGLSRKLLYDAALKRREGSGED
ncbi:MAG: 16S rRNA (cytidine(1402)-2'-O)-methyltransferase [Oscillospiraceae bacterium]|nr:16S rRNA (cytidine(1402)-2'-O)-methyltransferase [Oscillospiraceae bacterium]